MGTGYAGTVRRGSGGTVHRGSGGTVRRGSGGIVHRGSGGVVRRGSGGTVRRGSGGSCMWCHSQACSVDVVLLIVVLFLGWIQSVICSVSNITFLCYMVC